MGKRKSKGGDEYDAFSKSRKYLSWARGETKRIKQRANRRDRRTFRLEKS